MLAFCYYVYNYKYIVLLQISYLVEYFVLNFQVKFYHFNLCSGPNYI